ncbi:MAG: hypothetical protein ACLFUB_08045 [Cyclobacteriaceae bacterium]
MRLKDQQLQSIQIAKYMSQQVIYYVFLRSTLAESRGDREIANSENVSVFIIPLGSGKNETPVATCAGK